MSESLRQNSEFRLMKFAHDHLRAQRIIPRRSKATIDTALVARNGLPDEQLDDIKHCMGQGADAND